MKCTKLRLLAHDDGSEALSQVQLGTVFLSFLAPI